MTGAGPDEQHSPSHRHLYRRIALVLVLIVVCCGVAALILVVRDRWLPARSEAEVRQELIDKIAEAEAVWAMLDDLWGRLEAGQAVLCREETVTRPYFLDWRLADRTAYPDLAALAGQVNAAIRSLHRAADAWTAVCQSGQTGIPPQTAAEARASLDNAAAALAVLGDSPLLQPTLPAQ